MELYSIINFWELRRSEYYASIYIRKYSILRKFMGTVDMNLSSGETKNTKQKLEVFN